MIFGWYVKYSCKCQRWHWRESEWWMRGVWVAHRRWVIMGLLEPPDPSRQSAEAVSMSVSVCDSWGMRVWFKLNRVSLPQRAPLQTPGASSISHWGTSEDREQCCIHLSAPDIPYAQSAYAQFLKLKCSYPSTSVSHAIMCHVCIIWKRNKSFHWCMVC